MTFSTEHVSLPPPPHSDETYLCGRVFPHYYPYLCGRVFDPKVREPPLVIFREVTARTPLKETGKCGLGVRGGLR